MSNFKVGDWVKYKGNDDDSLYQVVVLLPNDLIDMDCTITDKYDIELWQPKVGEWCWYKNLLVKVININNRDDGIISYSVSNLMLGESYSGAITLEPFIGQLPTFLKETKCN